MRLARSANADSVVLDLASLPPAQRFPAWQAIAEPFFDVRLRHDDAQSFTGHVRSTTFGEALLVESVVSGQSYERDTARALAGNWDQVALQVYRRGHFQGDYDGQIINAGPGDVNVIDFTRPYKKIATDEADLNLIVPRSRAARCFPTFAHGMVVPASSAQAPLIATSIARLADLAHAMTAQEAAALIDSIFMLAAKAPMRRAHPAIRASAAASLREIAVRAIREHLLEQDLDPDRLCCLTGASRATLFRAFVLDGGVSTYIRTERLRLAARLLRELPHVPIGSIATKCGFSDHSMFSRQFRNLFGISPKDARTIDPEGRIGPGASDASQWLRSLRLLDGVARHT